MVRLLGSRDALCPGEQDRMPGGIFGSGELLDLQLDEAVGGDGLLTLRGLARGGACRLGSFDGGRELDPEVLVLG
ncbi:hypothetical protein GCM10025867_49420 (plasmid) [Frondihabitans sucicola]|uniref:Uncharacterized protein n=2 Tax=Frondihabitans sucicola TaxID=1268041 RepID=A0ABM8GW40_9MICO|nr:hypothetical protein GCM10025867_49420 [Frondihabitans sucicola]